MDARAALETNHDKIRALAAKHGAVNVRVFGSVARGDQDEASDLDLLVDLQPGRGLIDLGALLMDLRDLLSVPVDVITTPMLKERIRDRVLRQAVTV
jgi:predicted nucleotidyltransferase